MNYFSDNNFFLRNILDNKFLDANVFFFWKNTDNFITFHNEKYFYDIIIFLHLEKNKWKVFGYHL